MKNSKKLKIFFIDFDDIKNPLLGAGQAKATVEVCSRLVKSGHEVTVICSKYPNSKDRRENGIYYRHIGFGTKNIRINNLLYILSVPLVVMRLKGDVVVECFTAPISTLFSPLFTKIPVIGLPTSFEADRFSKLYHFPFDKIENFGLRFYKYFLPYTPYLDQKMKKQNSRVISKIVPEGVEEYFFTIKQKKPKHILFLGRLDMGQKGIDLLLNAYSLVVNQIKYPLIIAGNGPDEDKVQKMIEDLKLTDSVMMVGPAFGEKKEKLLSESLFVAFPSRHEGFSLFSLEALASGLPLICFNIPSLSWTNEDVALKAKAFNVRQYANILLKATNPKMINKMRKNARVVAKRYTWDQVSDGFESFFVEIFKSQKNN